MPENILHPSRSRCAAASAREVPPDTGHQEAGDPEALRIDWTAARLAERACCCPAKPVVIVIMPPTPDRPHRTDLLLCGHHCRASRVRLGTLGAVVLSLSGTSVTADPWSASPAARGIPC